jgi:hypothetical protein
VANQTPAEPSQPLQATNALPSVPDNVKIGDEEIPADQLADLVKKGKMVKEWESQKPGYSLDSLYPEFTRKSQELAELKRRQADLAPSYTVPSYPDVPNLNQDEQMLLQKAVTPLIETALQRARQSEKDSQALENFKKVHAEYDEPKRWNDFAGFFNNYYKLPPDPLDQIKVMEMAHQSMNFEAEVRKKSLESKGQALANQQKLEMASTGGGGQKTPSTPYDNLTPEQLRYMKDWTLL